MAPHLPAPRRVLALLLFGCAYLTYGITLLIDHHELPGPGWLSGALFISGGLVALGTLAHRTARTETVAFTWLYTVAALFAVGHLGAWLLHTGHAHPWSDMLTWTMVAALVALVGGWAETCPPAVLAEAQKMGRVRRGYTRETDDE